MNTFSFPWLEYTICEYVIMHLEANIWVLWLIYQLRQLKGKSTRMLASNQDALWDVCKWSIVRFSFLKPDSISAL